jgi:hypothetical protein
VPAFIGDRYIPEARPDVALDQTERLRDAVRRHAAEGQRIRLLSTTFVPNEEWVFDLFEAESADQVQSLYEASGVPVERVTPGVHIPES